MVPSYFYLKPNVFGVVGFAYGKVEGSPTRGGKVKVKLVQSGRWAEEDDQSIDLVEADISPRAVTAEEAENGAGTFVGGVICTPRVRPGGARVWDYGLVVGYKWDSEQQKRSLDVNFDGTESSIVCNHSSTQDVSVEIYALQPCGGRSTSLLMFQEMKQQHETVYNRFNGIGQTAIRDSRLLIDGLGGRAVDESKILPLLDITSFEISKATIQHFLGFVF